MKILEWNPHSASVAALEEVAELNLAAYSRYYAALGLSGDRQHELSKSLLLVRGGELERGRISIDEMGAICGFTAFLPEAEFRNAVARTAFETIKFVAKAERTQVTATMQETAQRLPPLAGESVYLSRIAVRTDLRGTGLGRRLVKDFYDCAVGYSTSLHVDADNTVAIALYQKCGYRVLDRSETVLYMRRPVIGGET